jgi:phosphoglucosamine mutase
VQTTLFGTDGIRGRSGQSPLTVEDLRRVGRAAARFLIAHRTRSTPLRVLLVRDTRASGPALGRAVADGFTAEGAQVFDAGILPTPSLAYLVPQRGFDAGIVISASHNPPEYNGVKFLTPQGTKWPDAWERAAEAGFAQMRRVRSSPAPRGRVIRDPSAANEYFDFLRGTFPRNLSLSGMRLVVDCAQGATSALAPRLLTALGAAVTVIGNHPTGRNINVGCGSQHPEPFLKLIPKRRARAGMAFDGDGDRVVFGDEAGRLCDGDHIIGMLAQDLGALSSSNGRTVVITVMANLGLRKALRARRIRWVETAVGDRTVSEAMRKNHAALGGEQSGHIILNRYLKTGDGMLTALHVLALLARTGKTFSALAGCVRKYPQVLVNVPVRSKPPLPKIPDLKKAISDVEAALAGRGRVLVRYSGTEPYLRIMMEGPNKAMLERYARRIAETAERCL